MFEFFIALFGGLFLVSGLGLEKLITLNDDIESKDREKKFKEIQEKYEASPELSSSIKAKIRNASFDELCEELDEDLKFVYCINHDDYKEDVEKCRRDYSIYRDIFNYWAYHLLLAHMGKIYKWVLQSGFDLRKNRMEGIEIEYEYSSERYCERIEQHLRKYNDDLKFYIKPIILYYSGKRVPDYKNAYELVLKQSLDGEGRRPLFWD